jgi:hypothetical protein
MRRQPPVAVLDMNPPGMRGREPALNCRGHGPSQALLAAVTGSGQDRDKKGFPEPGFRLSPCQARRAGPLKLIGARLAVKE